MKPINILFVLFAQIGLIHAKGRILPGWISARNKAIVSVAEVSVSGRNVDMVFNVKASVISDFTNNWEDEDTIKVEIPVERSFRAADPWLSRCPEKGDRFFVYGNRSISDLKSPMKMLISDAEAGDMIYILSLDEKHIGVREKSAELAKYISNRKSEVSSVYLWQYIHYLISAEMGCVGLIQSDVYNMANSDDCMRYVGEMMSEFGYMGQLSPESRKFGKWITVLYLSRYQNGKIDSDVAKSFDWIAKFNGETICSNEEKVELVGLKKKVVDKKIDGFSPGFLDRLFGQ